MAERLKDLLEKRALVWERMQAIRRRAADEHRTALTDTERREWDRAEAELGQITALVEATQAENHRAKAAAAEVGFGSYGDTGDVRPLRRDQRLADWAASRGLIREEERELSFGKYLRGMVTGEWRGADAERRAMSEGTTTAGGFMVPTLLSTRIVDLARNKARVMQAGATIVPMENSVVNVAKWTGDPTPAWHTENATISPSDATVGRLTLTATTLPMLTLISRELLEDATVTTPSIDGELEGAFAAQISLGIDSAALYGTGVAPMPRGLRNTSGITVQSMGANGAAPTNYDFLIQAVGTLRGLNEEPNGIIYSPRTEQELATLKDGQNRYLDPPQALAEIKRYSTNQVLNTQTQGTSAGVASDVFVGDWGQLFIGVRTSLQLTVLDQRYADSGQVGFLAWWRGDVQVARPKAFDVIEGVL